MEELEIKPEGEAPQSPEDGSPATPDPAAPAAVEDLPAPDAEAPPEGAPPATPDPAAPAAVEDLAVPDAEAPAATVIEELEIDPEGEALQSPEGDPPATPDPAAPIAVEDLLADDTEAPAVTVMEDVQLMAVLEAVVYVAEEPLTMAQIAAALQQPVERVDAVLRQLIAELEKPERGLAIREVAGGFKMATKAEHHEAVRSFVKSLKPPMKLSLPALETLAVIAYKQPVTVPEIMEIRGVKGGGVLKTLLDRKLIAEAGRKNVIGKPILYKTTRDFLIQFGLNDVNELPSLKEFEDIRRMAFGDSEPAAEPAPDAPQPPAPEAEPAAPDQES
jgi:segregation and condensation protein B